MELEVGYRGGGKTKKATLAARAFNATLLGGGTTNSYQSIVNLRAKEFGVEPPEAYGILDLQNLEDVENLVIDDAGLILRQVLQHFYKFKGTIRYMTIDNEEV